MKTPATSARGAGVLLHPTSLPGPYGIGDLGVAAYRWIDALAQARQTWWQVLPLGPTGYGDSPYQCFSAFAGNPTLISPDGLVEDGLLNRDDLAGAHFPADRVDFGPVIEYKARLLNRAWESFCAGKAPALRPLFEQFCDQQAAWLREYALFMALKDAHGGGSYLRWHAGLILRHKGPLEQARRELAVPIGMYQFRQFLFFRQWKQLKNHAHAKGIQLIGDVPIFVASDSADVWANPSLFQLDERRQPRVVAGVPPDYFSKTGQLWGNPLYNWEAIQEQGYAWWVARMRATLELVDLIRLDHFRGFEAYWEIPAGEETAVKGRWVKGPGDDLFEALRRQLGHLPLIAEDLGDITEEVEQLRQRWRLPGMRILQFAFNGGSESRFLPHNFEHNTVVYTGTHDNDTTRGWYAALPESNRWFFHRYLGHNGGHEIAWDLIRMAWASVGDFALTPLQDVLNLGTEARMNFPGRFGGNWTWRFTADQLTSNVLDRLTDLTDVYKRSPET